MSQHDQMESAKRVVLSVMKTRGAKQLFNVPVDPVALNLSDYFDIISHPIDLGTIHTRLVQGQKCDWGQGSHYTTTTQVYEDVSRVWSNCYAYNKAPQDAPVRELCRKTQKHFEKKWRETGLLKDAVINETDVPEVFSIRKEGAALPVRLLDAFSIALSSNLESYFPLDKITADNISHVQATGQLTLPSQSQTSNASNDNTCPVRLRVLLDWCFQYGNFPGVWLVTEHAWYKLLNPCEQYTPYVAGTLDRFMRTMVTINFPDLLPSLPSGDSTLSDLPMAESIPDDVADLLMEIDSIKEEATPYVGKRSRSPSSMEQREENGDIEEIQSGVSSFSLDSNAAALDPPKTPASTQRCLRSTVSDKEATKKSPKTKTPPSKVVTRDRGSGRKKPRTQDTTPGNHEIVTTLSELDEEDPLFDPSCDVDTFLKDDEDEDYVQGSSKKKNKKGGESEAQRLKREKKALEQLKKDQEADRRRGLPPPPMIDFRLPQEHLGLALSCWDFLMTFHIPLECPPFPFWRFEAAVCSLHQGKRKSEIRHRLQSHAQRYVQDVDAKASSLLLQDMHSCLCRVLQGKASFTKDTPSHASMDNKPSSQGHWTQSMSILLLKSSADDVDDETRAAAAFLHGHEYMDVPIYGKLKMLYALINMVVSADVFREHLNGIVDKTSLQKTQQYEEAPLNAAVLESMHLSFERKALNLSTEKWINWFLAHRVGVLSSIGADYKGSHYWILGNVSGCFRIYVEHRGSYEQFLTDDVKGIKSKSRSKTDGSFWGWYEGEGIMQFIDWLEEGDLESEKPLLETVRRIPKPIQLERSRSHTETTLNVISLGYHKMDRATLEAFRMDSYADVRYPLMRGEGEISGTPNDIHPAVRITACVRALLSSIPFWEKEVAVNGRICSVIDRIVNHQDASALATDVSEAVDLVVDHGCTKEEWKAIRKEWKQSLCSCVSLHGITAHLTVFQNFLLSPSHSVHRPAFNAMVHDAKCMLYFPMPGERIVLLKTGCLEHLDRYLEHSSQTIAGQTALPCYHESHHPNHVKRAKDGVEQLSPVEIFQVSCIAYRSPYPDPPPPETTLAVDPSIPVLPCMWLLLSTPIDSFNPVSIALPLHVNITLPDFIVSASSYEQSQKTRWKIGDRFKMFFAGKSVSRCAGGYYKGTISGVKPIVPGESYDPWESLTVEWDNDHSGASMTVSPWEIEVDPEEQRKLEEARVRQLDARARQARAFAKPHRSEFLVDMLDGDETQSVGDPDYDPLADSEGPKSTHRSRRRGSALQELVYYDPKNPAGPVPQEIMAIIPGRYEFSILIHNFMQRLKGKFKCPVFSGKDLDLYKVFHEVQSRGGYEVVTNLKLWKDVCRTLNVNLKGQTSASYNMRLNYEKCLLDFEHYLASGRYTQELQNRTAPSCTMFESFPQKLREFELDAVMAKGDRADGEHMVTRGSRRHRNVSLTQLLMEETSGPSAQPTDPTERTADFDRVISPLMLKRKDDEEKESMHLPIVELGTINDFDLLKHPHGSKLHRVEIQPGESIGMALDRLGWALIGSRLWRKWSGRGGWYEIEVTDYNRSTNEYCLTINKGTETEGQEWIDLRELESDEISQWQPSSGEMPKPSGGNREKPSQQLPTVERNEFSQLLKPPRALQRFGTDPVIENRTSMSLSPQGLDSMNWIQQMMTTGICSEFLNDPSQEMISDAKAEEFQRKGLEIPPVKLEQPIGTLTALLADQPSRMVPPPPRMPQGDEGEALMGHVPSFKDAGDDAGDGNGPSKSI